MASANSWLLPAAHEWDISPEGGQGGSGGRSPMQGPQALESWQESESSCLGLCLAPPHPQHKPREEKHRPVSPFVNSCLRGPLGQLPVCGQEACSLMGSALRPHQIPSQGMRSRGCMIPKGLPPPALTLTCLSGTQMTMMIFTEHPSSIQ